MIADYTTWCGPHIKAAIILEKILNDIGERRIISHVNKLNNQFDTRLISLSLIKDTKIKNYFIRMLHSDFKDRVNNNEIFPYLVKTHLLNIFHAKIIENKAYE